MGLSMKIALKMALLTMVVTGILYPMAMTGIAAVAFPDASRGSLVTRDGTPVGSRLIAQQFESDRYFHSRPSAVAYDPTRSGASNLAPTSDKLIAQLRARRQELVHRERLETQGLVPVDAVTSSGSGLDPHMSPAAARLQVARVALARGLEERVVTELVEAHIENRQLGVLGEPRVNVLELNLDLDRLSAEAR